jgi:hypothetical protein
MRSDFCLPAPNREADSKQAESEQCKRARLWYGPEPPSIVDDKSTKETIPA